MAAKSWLSMSNWTAGKETFASAIGLGKYIKYPQLTAQLPGQANAAATPTTPGAPSQPGDSGNSPNTSGGKVPNPTPGATPTPPINATESAFWASVLATLGAPATSANINSLNAWAQHESIWPGGPGKGGMYNPLNTTLGQPGATNFNSVGVKNYNSPAQGVTATVQTLLGGYPNIVSALKSGKGLCGNSSTAGEFSKWSGGGYSSVC